MADTASSTATSIGTVPAQASPRIAVMGAGAVGCYYGGMLARAGLDVTLVARPAHVAAIAAAGGLRLEAPRLGIDAVVPLQAVAGPEGVAGADLVLVCVKSGDTEAAAAAMAPHLAAAARVLSLQNGVDNAARLQAALGRPVWPVVVYMAAGMAGPGHVRHQGRGELLIGRPAGADTDTGTCTDDECHVWSPETVAACFTAAGVSTTVSDQALGALWAKLVLNCAWNGLSALTMRSYGDLFAQPGVDALLADVVGECLQVAAALGVQVPGDVAEAVAGIARTMPGQVSSTAQDLQRDKPTEIDHLNGFIVREGQRLGVATPANRAVWTLVKLAETRPGR